MLYFIKIYFNHLIVIVSFVNWIAVFTELNNKSALKIKKDNRSLLVYALALLITFIYFINLISSANFIVNLHENRDTYFGADVAKVVDNLADNEKISHYRD